MSEAMQRAKAGEAQTKINLAMVQQQKHEQQIAASYKTEKAAKLGTEAGASNKNLQDNLVTLAKFSKADVSIKTSQAKNYVKIQDAQIKQAEQTLSKLKQSPSKYTINGKPVTGSVIDDYQKSITEAKANLQDINRVVAQGEITKTQYNKYIKELEKQSLQPQIKEPRTYKTTPEEVTRKVRAEKVLSTGTVGGATTPRKQVVDRRSALNRGILYSDIIQRFYDKSGKLPSQEEQIKYLKSQGLEPSKEYRAKTVGEALNRLAYAATETLGGGIREATLGLSGSLGVEKRPGGIYFQVAGGIATPTALDYVAAAALAKLAPLKNGKKILQKIESYYLRSDADMWANKQIAAKAIKNFESGNFFEGPDLTTQRRNAETLLKTLNLDEAKPFITTEEFRTLKRLSDLAEKKDIAKLENLLNEKPTSEYLRTAELPVTSNWQLLRNTVKKIDPTISFKKDIPLDEILTPNEYKLWRKQFTDQGIDWDTARNLNKDQLKKLVEANLRYIEKNPDAPRLTQINQLYDESIDALGYDGDAYIDMLKKYKVDPDLAVSILLNVSPKDRVEVLEAFGFEVNKPIAGFTTLPLKDMSIPELRDLAKDLDIDDVDAFIAQVQEIKQDSTQVQEIKQDSTQVQGVGLVTPTVEAPEFEPPEPEDIPEPTPPLMLSPREMEKRKDINLSLYRGKKVHYEVDYSFKGGKTQHIGPLEARSLPDALGKAQRQRMTNKNLPHRIVVNMIGEKR